MAKPRLLFLDFDGVLHPTLSADAKGGRVDVGLFGWLPTLLRLLHPHPDVEIVVHSTWRNTHDLAELRLLLCGLGQRVLGTAPSGRRYDSIRAWSRINAQFESHRILDDNPAEFPRPLPAELLLCDPAMGVTSPDVQAALQEWLAS